MLYPGLVLAHVVGTAPGNTSVFVHGVGWGEDVNVHVKLQKQLMLRTCGVGGGVGRGC